jgi:RHS repeat-associated protein
MTFDPDGNLTSLTDGGATTTFTWDARNRLAALAGGTTGSFAYDAQARRTRRDIGGELRQYQYDGLKVIRERLADPEVAYLQGLGIDEPLTRRDATAPAFYLADALGSTLALTDGTGGLATSYTYGPFGQTTSSGSASGNPFQFTARENDGAGLYFYRARYYAPDLGRFISEDPAGRTQGSSLYAYVGNSPLLFVDPLGLEALMVTGVVTGYDNGPRSTGKRPGHPAYGITASGRPAAPGTVAADRRIPFGTKVIIPGYGEGIVLDRGGVIKGLRFDVWFPTERQALEWGRRTLPIYILNFALRG